jgi:hypothetical protein
MLARLAVIVAAIGASHGHHDSARLERVATDVWQAAVERPAYCSDPSTDAGQYATALALTGIATHESGWHPKVQACTYGQRDPAISLFALNGPVAFDGHSKRAICADNMLAARLSAKVLERFKGCHDVSCQARGYASGDTRVRSDAAREIADQIATLHWRERIFVTYIDGCLTAAYRKD